MTQGTITARDQLERWVREELCCGSRGHFATRLGEAWLYADSSNRTKLEQTWPSVFTASDHFKEKP